MPQDAKILNGWPKELAAAYSEKGSRCIALEGNIDDIYFLNWNRGFLNLRSCLLQIFGDFEIKCFYSRSESIAFPDHKSRQNFFKCVQGKKSSTQRQNKQNNKYSRISAEHNRDILSGSASTANARYQDPVDALADLTKALRIKRTRALVVVMRAHNLVSAQFGDHRILDYLESWGTEPEICSTENLSILVTSDSRLLSPAVGAGRAINIIKVDLPTSPERKRLLAFFDARYGGLIEGPDWAPCVNATKGLKLIDMVGIIKSAINTKQKITAKMIKGFLGENPWDEKSPEEVLRFKDILLERIIGQNEAVTSVANALRRTKAGIRDTERPMSFIFIGPTGVGKTQLARELAEILYGHHDDIIRLDMSEYMEKHSVARFIGASPGYVGYEEGGQLTERVKKEKKSTVILLDEIEKAHPDVLNILLQILDAGRLTDGKGDTVDFSQTVIIMTSNLGQKTAETAPTKEERKSLYMQAIKQNFSPEFINRVDEIVIFNQLTPEVCQVITRLLLRQLSQRLFSHNKHKLIFDDSAVAYLVKVGIDPEYGARPLRRAVEKYLENPLSEEILKNSPPPFSAFFVSGKDGGIHIKIEKERH